MTPQELDLLTEKERAAWKRHLRATTRPWKANRGCVSGIGKNDWVMAIVGQSEGDQLYNWVSMDSIRASELRTEECEPISAKADAEYIAEARQDLPDALEEIARLRQLVKAALKYELAIADHAASAIDDKQLAQETRMFQAAVLTYVADNDT